MASIREIFKKSKFKTIKATQEASKVINKGANNVADFDLLRLKFIIHWFFAFVFLLWLIGYSTYSMTTLTINVLPKNLYDVQQFEADKNYKWYEDEKYARQINNNPNWFQDSRSINETKLLVDLQEKGKNKMRTSLVELSPLFLFFICYYLLIFLIFFRRAIRGNKQRLSISLPIFLFIANIGVVYLSHVAIDVVLDLFLIFY